MEIACVEVSRLLSPTDLAFLVRAVNQQMEEHFGPAFEDVPWPVRSYASLQTLEPGTFWPLAILDDLGKPGALGFHDDVVGLVFGRVLASSDPTDGTTLSHEALELRGDPRCDLWLPMPDGRQVARELCLAAGTIVPQSDGSVPTIRDLAARGGEFDVLARDRDGRLVVARATNARRTGVEMPVVRVYLTDNTLIRCTDNHRIMMADGLYGEAGLLRPGDRLSDTSPRFAGSCTPNGGLVDVVHVGKYGDGVRALPDGHHVGLGQPGGRTGGAALIPVSGHAPLPGGVEHVIDMGSREQVRWVGADRVVAPVAHVETIRDRSAMNLVRQSMNVVDSAAETNLPIPHGVFGARPIPAPGFVLDHSALVDFHGGRRSGEVEAGEPSINTPVVSHPSPMHATEALRAIRSLAPRDSADPHGKIVDRVEQDGHDDVYDLTVPGLHNFALGAGVFVHNCDPCEQDRYDIEVTIGDETRRIWVSDFVLPAWFVPGAPSPYTWLDTVDEPFGLSRNGGGYRLIRDADGSLSSDFGRHAPDTAKLARKVADPLSRTHRRGLR